MRKASHGNVQERVSVVVDYLGGSTTTNHEGLMMRGNCDTKRDNTMVRTCLEVVVHCPKESDYFLTVDGLLVLLVVKKNKLILWKD
jgi:hypothetical protein